MCVRACVHACVCVCVCVHVLECFLCGLIREVHIVSLARLHSLML